MKRTLICPRCFGTAIVFHSSWRTRKISVPYIERLENDGEPAPAPVPNLFRFRNLPGQWASMQYDDQLTIRKRPHLTLQADMLIGVEAANARWRQEERSALDPLMVKWQLLEYQHIPEHLHLTDLAAASEHWAKDFLAANKKGTGARWALLECSRRASGMSNPLKIMP